MDSERARDAFEELRPQLDRLTALQPAPVDIEEAAAHAADVGRMVLQPEIYENFAELPAEIFDIRHVDNLEKAALATLYAVARHHDAVHGSQAGAPANADADASENPFDEHAWAEYVKRAWTFLLTTYEEVSAAGRWLYRKEDGQDRFPSLIISEATKRNSNGRHDPDVEAEILSQLTVEIPAKLKPS